MLSIPKNRFRSRALAQAAAATPALALISTAQAQTIVWSGVLDQSITASGSIPGQTVNLDFNLNGSLDSFEGYLESFYQSKEDSVLVLRDTPDSLRYTSEPVSAGTLLFGNFGDSKNGVIHDSGGGGGVPAGTSRYFGLKFADGAGPHAGWMQVSVSADGLTTTLNQWAYSSAAFITVGQTSAVPEPATYGVMCGIALAGWAVARRRRGNRSIA